MSTHRTAYSRIALTAFSALAIAFLAPSVWSKAYADDSYLFGDSENGVALSDAIDSTFGDPAAVVTVDEALAQNGGEGPGLVDEVNSVAAPDTMSGIGLAPAATLVSPAADEFGSDSYSSFTTAQPAPWDAIPYSE